MKQESNKVIRWGILGCARVARKRWIPAIEKEGTCQISSIASRTLDKARTWADELGIGRAFGSYEQLLEDDAVDAVFIGLPNSLDCQWVVKSLAAGKHVLCDKPLGVNAADAGEMARAANRCNRLLMEGFAYRYHCQYEVMQKWLDQNLIGRLKRIRVGFSFVFDRPGDIRYDPKLGGGALLDLGCYCVHVSRLMSRAEPIAVQAKSSNNDTGVDWTTRATLKFADGLEAVFDCSFDYEGDRSMDVVGTEGLFTSTAPFVSNGESELCLKAGSITKHEKIQPMNAYISCVGAFNERIRTGNILPTPATDSVANMRVLDAVRESAQYEHAVSLTK